jgi:uncharacterized membrane protein YdjX (TVP38/TMEM64 family)
MRVYEDQPGDQEPGPGRRSPPPGGHWLALAGLLAILILVLAFWYWRDPFGALWADAESVREWMAGFGALAPLISIVLNAAQVLLAPVPGQVIGLANGFLFGVFWGTLYSLAGVTLGSATAMAVARVWGRSLVERLVNPEHLNRWDQLANQRGPAVLLLVYLLPLLPDDLISFAVGLSRLSIPYVLILAAAGRLPGLIATSWIGANASAIRPLGWLILGIMTIVLAVIVLRYQRQLEAWMLRLARRWGRHSAENGEQNDLP